MEKAFNLKKKSVYNNDNDVEKTITVKINLIADHLLDSSVVESIERQLFNINLNISNYTIEIEQEKIKEKAVKVPAENKTKKTTKKLITHYNGSVVEGV